MKLHNEEALKILSDYVDENQMIDEFGMLGALEEKFMLIPKPAAFVGDTVLVDNYRRNMNSYEQGKVISSDYKQVYETWSHRVNLCRKSGSGRNIYLNVSCDKIKKIITEAK